LGHNRILSDFTAFFDHASPFAGWLRRTIFRNIRLPVPRFTLSDSEIYG